MDKVDIAIMRLREASQMSQQIYGKPLIVTDSGGKDSSVCVHIAQKAGIPFEVMHNHTTADAPETVRFVREKFKLLEDGGIKCTISYPVYNGKRTSMWEIIPKKLIPPTMVMRYCCDILKEQGGKGRFITTGVRWAESMNRRNKRGIYEAITRNVKNKIILNNDNDELRRLFEACTVKAKHVCNPIIDWTDRDIWHYIQAEHITINPLYECGFDRVGCVGCPMARKKRYRNFARWPRYKSLYITAFDKMLEERRRRGKLQGEFRMGTTGEEVFHWWMEDGVLPGQTNIFDEEGPG